MTGSHQRITDATTNQACGQAAMSGFTGTASASEAGTVLINPAYELLG
ncbi:MAG TPA: hypothetical protein VGH53_16690 [Streptosporangiaceae bacterium]